MLWKRETLCMKTVVVNCDDGKLMSSTIGMSFNRL